MYYPTDCKCELACRSSTVDSQWNIPNESLHHYISYCDGQKYTILGRVVQKMLNCLFICVTQLCTFIKLSVPEEYRL